MKLRSLVLACGLLTSVCALAGGSQNHSERVDGFWDGGRIPSVRALQAVKLGDFIDLGGYEKFLTKVAALGEDVKSLELVHNPIFYQKIFPILLLKPQITSLKISIDPERMKDMDEPSFAALVDYLKHTKTLQKFEFYQGYISGEMGHRFAKALAQNTSIKSFSLQACTLGAEAIQPFSGVPGKNRQRKGALETLSLTGMFGAVKHEEWCGDLLDSLTEARPGFTLHLPLDEDGCQRSYEVQEDGKVAVKTREAVSF